MRSPKFTGNVWTESILPPTPDENEVKDISGLRGKAASINIKPILILKKLIITKAINIKTVRNSDISTLNSKNPIITSKSSIVNTITTLLIHST